MFVVQSRGRGRTGLDEVQGTARSGSGLRARTGVVDLGSAVGQWAQTMAAQEEAAPTELGSAAMVTRAR